MGTTSRYDLDKLRDDLDLRGWLPTDLARSSGLTDQTISRFLKGDRVNPRTADRIARALGYGVGRYLIRRKKVA